MYMNQGTQSNFQQKNGRQQKTTGMETAVSAMMPSPTPRFYPPQPLAIQFLQAAVFLPAAHV